jgi:hypothetical protein
VEASAPKLFDVGEAAQDDLDGSVARDESAVGGHACQVSDERAKSDRREQRVPHLRRGQVLSGHRFPGQALGLDEAGGGRGGGGCLGEAMGAQETRGRFGGLVIKLADSPSQSEVGRAVALWCRLAQAEEVAVGPPVALLILNELEREGVGVAVGVPASNGAAQASTPATELLDEASEQEQVRPGPAHSREGIEGEAAHFGVGARATRSEGEDDRRLLRVPSCFGDRNDLSDGSRPIEGEAPQHRLGVLA